MENLFEKFEFERNVRNLRNENSVWWKFREKRKDKGNVYLEHDDEAEQQRHVDNPVNDHFPLHTDDQKHSSAEDNPKFDHDDFAGRSDSFQPRVRAGKVEIRPDGTIDIRQVDAIFVQRLHHPSFLHKQPQCRPEKEGEERLHGQIKHL